MKNNLKLLLIAVTFLCSCGAKKKGHGGPNMETSEVFKSEITALRYFENNIILSDDFIGYDASGKQISKNEFIQALTEDKVWPVKLISYDSLSYYQLMNVKTVITDYTANFIYNMGRLAQYYHGMEGQNLPDFNFTDINGEVYNKKTMSGKIVVLKFWFIGCKACVEEMPEVNKIAEAYSKNKKIVFLSLAYDSPDQLKKFLKNRDFKYQTAGNQKNYMREKLHVPIYPSHMIINGDGVILKYVPEYKEMEKALKKIAEQKL